MSVYSTDDYEFSFAERTIKNLELIQRKVSEEKAQGKSDNEISDAFEVTQLINSFVGLLIIPRQKCFRHMPDDIKFPPNSVAEELFERIKNDHNICEYTYLKQKYVHGKWIKTSEIEEISPKILSLRMRNAVSHDRLKIQPLDPGKDGIITGIEFSDRPSGKNTGEYFRLLLNIYEVEVLVKALSELLLSCYPH